MVAAGVSAVTVPARMLGDSCGPHCGAKERIVRHCDGCHRGHSHGNAIWSSACAELGWVEAWIPR